MHEHVRLSLLYKGATCIEVTSKLVQYVVYNWAVDMNTNGPRTNDRDLIDELKTFRDYCL
jgi:hypothetical protein